MVIQTRDIVSAIQELSSKTDNSYSSDFLTNQRAKQIEEIIPQSIQTHLNAKDERATGISMLVSMSYKSMTGHVKDRDILVRKVVQSRGEFFIHGLAMDIKAPRLIKVRDIEKIQDMTSGKIYTNPVEFIEQRLGVPMVLDTKQATEKKSDFQKVIERTGPAMTVLMFLSGVDGRRGPIERQKIIEHVRSRTTDLNYTDDEINDYLIALAPDLESFKLALQQVLSKDKSVVQSVVQSMLGVITADGAVADRERAFLSRIISLLEQEGFEFNLPI